MDPRQRVFWGSFILGFGLLGALDGIVFHQLLQWHSVNMHTDRHGQIISDGFFHIFTLLSLLWGVSLLWTAEKPRAANRILWSGLLMGGGSFQLVEGIVNHHLLELHHVKPGDPHQLLYDLLFLAAGGVLLLAGMVCGKELEKEEVVER